MEILFHFRSATGRWLHTVILRAAIMYSRYSRFKMAVRLRFCYSWIFIVWLSLTIILGSQKLAVKIYNKASIVYVSSGLNVKHFRTRNSGIVRKYERQSHVSPCLKCVAGLKIGNITFFAAFIVLLSVDVKSLFKHILTQQSLPE